MAELKNMAADSMTISRCIIGENRVSRRVMQRAREVR
jgi:ribosomal protein L22